jgi:hypothetical protein
MANPADSETRAAVAIAATSAPGCSGNQVSCISAKKPGSDRRGDRAQQQQAAGDQLGGPPAEQHQPGVDTAAGEHAEERRPADGEAHADGPGDGGPQVVTGVRGAGADRRQIEGHRHPDEQGQRKPSPQQLPALQPRENQSVRHDPLPTAMG